MAHYGCRCVSQLSGGVGSYDLGSGAIIETNSMVDPCPRIPYEILEMMTLHTCRVAGFDLGSQIESEDPLNAQFSEIK